jgi:hypothetical protein
MGAEWIKMGADKTIIIFKRGTINARRKKTNGVSWCAV